MGRAQIFAYISASTTFVILKGKSKNMKSSTQDKVAGTGKCVVGKVKEAAGRAVGNPRLQSKGQADQIEGQIQKKSGEIKKVFGK